MNFIAHDSETWLIAPGRLAPPMVCLTHHGHDQAQASILLKADGLALVEQWLKSDVVLVAHNAAFDMAVYAANAPHLLPLIFRAYRENRIADTGIWEQLYDIATGQTFNKKYSLAACAKRRLDVDIEGKTGEDAWRLRYRELDGVPLDQWPKAAIDYATLDATYAKALWEQGALREGIPNDFWAQCRAAWCLHLMSMWGVRTDQQLVDKLEAELREHVDAEMAFLETTPLFRVARKHREGEERKVTQNIKETALAVAKAYTGVKEGSPGTEFKSKAGRDLFKHLPNRPEVKALVRAIENKGNLERIPRTDKGGVGRSAAALLGSGDPTLLRLADISEDRKLLNTYVPLLRSQVINARYNVLVDSGRTSCAQPNLQNLPRRAGVRDCFVPRKGWWYLFADYSIAELCSLSHVLVQRYGDSEMARVIRAGRDIHLEVAANLAGCSYAEAEKRKDAKDKYIKDLRQLAKVLDFGIPGGMGATNFYYHTCREMAPQRLADGSRCSSCYGSGIVGGQPVGDPEIDKACSCIPIAGFSYDYVKDARDAWLDRFPEMRWYFRDIGELVEMGGGETVVESVGSGRLRGGVGYTNGCNHFFQALTADGAKAAMWLITEECYNLPDSPLFGCRPVFFIHDEFGLEVPADYAIARPAAKRLEELMIQGMSEYVTAVPTKADACLTTRWYKGAEPKYDGGGNLILWK